MKVFHHHPQRDGCKDLKENAMNERELVCSHCSQDVQQASDAKYCPLCNEIHCNECLNEAGLCVPCGTDPGYSKEEAINV
jgi:hypothetical protein